MNIFASIVSKLMVLVMVPLLALMITAGLGSSQEWQKYRAAQHTDDPSTKIEQVVDASHRLCPMRCFYPQL